MPASSYIAGDRRQLTVAVGASQTFAKGEMLCLSSNAVKNLAQLADSGTKAQNQAVARDVFIGVAMRAAVSAVPTTIPVATAGVFEFDCVSATFEVGDLVGPAGTGSGGNVGVSSSVVVAVADGSLAIGRVAKRGTSVTRVQVQIFTSVMRAPQDDTLVALASISTDVVSEFTATNGVVVDSVRLKDGIVFTPVTVGSVTSSTPSVTAALMAGGVIVATTQSTSTVTMDTGTALDSYFTSIVGTGVGFFWSMMNSNSGTMTFTANTTGNNLTGLATLATNVIGRYFTYRTGTNAWATIRVS